MGSSGFVLVIFGLMLAIFGMVIGFHVGQVQAQKASSNQSFWKRNAGIYAVFVLLAAVVWATGWVMLMFAVIGGLAGCIAGLKMGYTTPTGPWKAFDRFFERGSASQRARAAKVKSTGSGWAKRKPADEKPSQAPELISVAEPGSAKRAGTAMPGRKSAGTDAPKSRTTSQNNRRSN